jgi:glycosyltransferase involved in cell wall biosynthesis
MPLVTFLLPVLNAEKFLEQTLASVASQTFHDFEVLAWDNSSTDNSVSILRNWIPSKIPGKVVSDRPLELGACLAAMVTESSSKYCARIDSDDICAPRRLEFQSRFMEENSNIVACGTQMLKIDASGNTMGSYYRRPLKNADIITVAMTQNPLNHPTVMLRRSAVLEVGNYRNLKPLEDWDLWLRLTRIGELANLPGDLISYRIHEQSVTSNSGNLNSATTRLLTETSQRLFGLTPKELEEFRDIEFKTSKVFLFFKFTRHLAKTSGSFLSIWISPWLFTACGPWMSHDDIPSRVFLKLGAFLRKIISTENG